MTVLPALTLPPAPGRTTGPSSAPVRQPHTVHDRTETDDTASDRADRREDGPTDFVAELEAALAGAPQTTPPAADGTPDPSSQTVGDGSALVAAIPPALPGSTVNPLFSALPGTAGVTEAATSVTPAGSTTPATPASLASLAVDSGLGNGPLSGAAEGVVPAMSTGPATLTLPHADPAAPPATPTGTQPSPQVSTQAGPQTDGRSSSQTGQQSGGQSGTQGDDGRTTALLATASDTSQVSSTPVPTVAPTAATAPAAPSATTSSATAASVTGQTFPEITRLAQSAGPGTHRIAIVLNPESLGEVKVTMIARAGTLQVHLSADNPAARAALASGTGELHKMLELTAGADTRIVVRESSSSNPSNTNSDGGNRSFASGLAEQQTSQHGQQRQHASQQGTSTQNQYGASPVGSPRTAAPLTGAAPVRPTTTPAGRLDRLM